MYMGDEENRTTGLKEDFLWHDVVESVVIGRGLQHDRQIVQPR